VPDQNLKIIGERADHITRHLTITHNISLPTIPIGEIVVDSNEVFMVLRLGGHFVFEDLTFWAQMKGDGETRRNFFFFLIENEFKMTFQEKGILVWIFERERDFTRDWMWKSQEGEYC
jgi:hypothetical protein